MKNKLRKLTKYKVVRFVCWFLYIRWVTLDNASVIPSGSKPNKSGYYLWHKRMWLGRE